MGDQAHHTSMQEHPAVRVWVVDRAADDGVLERLADARALADAFRENVGVLIVGDCATEGTVANRGRRRPGLFRADCWCWSKYVCFGSGNFFAAAASAGGSCLGRFMGTGVRVPAGGAMWLAIGFPSAHDSGSSRWKHARDRARCNR